MGLGEHHDSPRVHWCQNRLAFLLYSTLDLPAFLHDYKTSAPAMHMALACSAGACSLKGMPRWAGQKRCEVVSWNSNGSLVMEDFIRRTCQWTPS